jgi:predicted phage tail protein
LREEWNKRKQAAIDGDEDILQVEINFWKLKLAAEKEGTKDYITIHGHLVDLEEQQQKKQTADLKKATDEWKRSLESLPKAFASVIRDMQKNMGGFRDFMRGMWYEIVAMSAQAGFDMLAGWVASELAKRKITKEGAVETIAIKTWEGIKWVAIHAAMAAAAAWSAIAGIPFVGPVLAPLAAAATLAGVLALGGAFSHGGGGGGGAPSAAVTAGRNISRQCVAGRRRHDEYLRHGCEEL